MKNIVRIDIPIDCRYKRMIIDAKDCITISPTSQLIKKAKFFLTMGKYRKSLSEYCEVKHDEIIGTIVGIDLENGILSCEIPEEKFRLYNNFKDYEAIPRALVREGKIYHFIAFDCCINAVKATVNELNKIEKNMTDLQTNIAASTFIASI